MIDENCNSDELDDATHIIATHAAFLGFTEIGIGSFFHAFHIPFRGNILSLNQIFILSHASSLLASKKQLFSPLTISIIGASLKSLSTVGKKVKPMLAIGMQGLLFNCGLMLFGNTFYGRLVGAVFSSLWSFVQPLLFYYLVFGKEIFHSLLFFSQRLSISEEIILLVVFTTILVKIIAALSLFFLAENFSKTRFEKYVSKLTKISRSKTNLYVSQNNDGKFCLGRAVVRSFRDLAKPLFLFSLSITVLFLWFSGCSQERLFYGFFRPLSIGFVSFFCLRVFPFLDLLEKIKNRNLKVLNATLNMFWRGMGKKQSENGE